MYFNKPCIMVQIGWPTTRGLCVQDKLDALGRVWKVK
jgi:hypothetical protein